MYKRPPVPHGRGRGGPSTGGMGAPPRGRGRGAAAAAQPSGRDKSFHLESGGQPAFAAIIRLTPDSTRSGGRRRPVAVPASSSTLTCSTHPRTLSMLVVKNSNLRGRLNTVNCAIFMKNVRVERMEMDYLWNVALLGARSIVLDPANPSVKSQAKSMAAAAVEGNMRRMHWKHKKDFLKKNQAAVIAPTKSVSKVKLSNNTPKGNFSTSPVPSPEPGASIPSFPVGLDANNEVITPIDLNNEDSNRTENVTPSKMSKGINRRGSAPSASVDDNTSEVRSLLISVLSENPKGMGLKTVLPKDLTDVFHTRYETCASLGESCCRCIS